MAHRTRPERAERAGSVARRDDGRWQELLRISAETFAERGYQAATLQEIADRFGVLKGSLYHYIRSKEDLLYEVVATVYAGGLANLRALAEGEGDAVTRLRSAVRGHVLYLIANLTETRVFLHEFEQLSEERRSSLHVEEYASVIAHLVEEGKTAGLVKPGLDAHLAALVVLGAINWVYRWYSPGGRYTPDQIADQCAESTVSGLLVTGTAA